MPTLCGLMSSLQPTKGGVLKPESVSTPTTAEDMEEERDQGSDSPQPSLLLLPGKAWMAFPTQAAEKGEGVC